MVSNTTVDGQASHPNQPSRLALRRALAAGPVSVVIFFVTLLFTGPAAVQVIGTSGQPIALRGSFTAVVAGTVVLIAAAVAFAFTGGRRLDDRMQGKPKWAAVSAFAAVGAAVGLVATVALVLVGPLVDPVAAGQAWAAAFLLAFVPAAVSGVGTRLVIDASSESLVELLVAFAAAVLVVWLFLWAMSDYFTPAVAG